MNSRRFIRSPVRGPHASIVAGMVSAWAAAYAQLRYRSSCFMATPVERYPKNFGQPSHLPAVNHPGYSGVHGTRPDTPVRARRRRHDALLTIWLTFWTSSITRCTRSRRNASKATAAPRHVYARALPNKGRQLQSVGALR